MTDDIANGIDPAGADARIATFLVDAGHLIGTFAVADTLVPTVRG